MAWGVRGLTAAGGTGVTTAVMTLLDAKIDVGDFVMLGIGVRNSQTVTVVSVADTRSNSWSRFGWNSAGGQITEIWGCIAVSGADTVITVTFSAAVNSDCAAITFTGAPVSGIAVAATGTGGSTASISHPCGMCDAIAGDLMVTWSSSIGAFAATVNANYTSLATGNNRALGQWREATGAFSSDAVFTTSAAEDMTSVQVVLRAAAVVSAALSGTAIVGGVTEAELVAGGQTIIITLTGDTFV